MIHPDFEDSWQVKAYIDGMAESNTIILNYKKVITDFNVIFSKNNRVITVGPLQSFMKQVIPDGLQVNLQIYKDNKLIKTYTKTSFVGFANFNLKSSIFNNDSYKLLVKTAGIEKTFNNKILW